MPSDPIPTFGSPIIPSGSSSGDLATHPEELRAIIAAVRSNSWTSSSLPRGFGPLRFRDSNEISFGSLPGYTFQNVGGVIHYRNNNYPRTNPLGRWVPMSGPGISSSPTSTPTTGGTDTFSGTTGTSASSTGSGSGNTITLPSGLVVNVRRDGRSTRYSVPVASLATTVRFPLPTTGGTPPTYIDGANFILEPSFQDTRSDGRRYTLPTIQILSVPGRHLTAEESRHQIRFNMEPNGRFTNLGAQYHGSPLIDLNSGAGFLADSSVSSTVLRTAGINFEAEFYGGDGGTGRDRLRAMTFSFTRPVAFMCNGQTYIINDGTNRTFRLAGGRTVTTDQTGIFTVSNTNELIAYAPPER